MLKVDERNGNYYLVCQRDGVRPVSGENWVSVTGSDPSTMGKVLRHLHSVT
jgi:hypothetical protein